EHETAAVQRAAKRGGGFSGVGRFHESLDAITLDFRDRQVVFPTPSVVERRSFGPAPAPLSEQDPRGERLRLPDARRREEGGEKSRDEREHNETDTMHRQPPCRARWGAPRGARTRLTWPPHPPTLGSAPAKPWRSSTTVYSDG